MKIEHSYLAETTIRKYLSTGYDYEIHFVDLLGKVDCIRGGYSRNTNIKVDEKFKLITVKKPDHKTTEHITFDKILSQTITEVPNVLLERVVRRRTPITVVN